MTKMRWSELRTFKRGVRLVSMAGLLVSSAQTWASGPDVPGVRDVPRTKGADIHEELISKTVDVWPSATGKPLDVAFKHTYGLLVRGIPVKVRLHAGTYRETVAGLDWSKGRAADTLFVIEGKGGVIWSGSNVFPRSEWKRSGALLSHPWPYRWGNFGYSWSPSGIIGHRSELAFVDGRPLRQRILERYQVDGSVQDPAKPGSISYKFLGSRDPEAVLIRGEFGVTDRAGSSSKIYVRLPERAEIGNRSIEVSVRKNLLDLRGKNSVVLRGITFCNTANDDGDFGANNAIRFSIAPDHLSHNVLIDRCRIVWSAQTGLHIDGSKWTVRDSDFSFNGGSGIAVGKSTDILWERNQTNFNVWRLWRAGELGYYTGGFKVHETTGHTINGHLSIGNCTMGAWWDIHCHNVYVRDLTAIGNAANMQFELCEGPLFADRLLLAGGRAGDGQLRMWEHGATRLQHSILYSNYRGSSSTGLYNLRWFGRTDRHAQIGKILAGENATFGNIFVGGPNVPNFGMIDDIRGPDWFKREPMTYRGDRNVFWNPSEARFQDVWIKDDDRKGELAARAISVGTWKKCGYYSELNALRVDPKFRDPDKGDFRFLPESPFYSKRSEYPQFHLDLQKLAQWSWFIQWSGYHPDAWNVPPEE